MYIRSHKGKSLIENLNDYTVLDIETTSLDSRDGEILEISALKIRNKKNSRKVFQTYKGK